ncbi:hypothetical protein DFJ73DRAFT_837591, partial [Zopfochytrium polystomum]
MGRPHRKYLDDESSLSSFRSNSSSSSGSSGSSKSFVIYGCCDCNTHPAFQGQHGKAYLFNRVCNVLTGPPETRTMTTGIHVVRDIYCSSCQATVGWKYDLA